MFGSEDKRLKKAIERREKKLEEMRRNAELYEQLAKQEEERKKLLEGPLKEYAKLQEAKAKQGEERKHKAIKVLDIMANHLLGDDGEERRKKEKKVKA